MKELMKIKQHAQEIIKSGEISERFTNPDIIMSQFAECSISAISKRPIFQIQNQFLVNVQAVVFAEKIIDEVERLEELSGEGAIESPTVLAFRNACKIIFDYCTLNGISLKQIERQIRSELINHAILQTGTKKNAAKLLHCLRTLPEFIGAAGGDQSRNQYKKNRQESQEQEIKN